MSNMTKTASRFELMEQGHTAFGNYHVDGDALYIDYVEAPPELRGTGAAGRLMEGIMAYVAENKLKAVPICGYAASWIKRHS